MSSAKLRCFQHNLFKSSHFLCFLSENMFWIFLATKLESLSLKPQKKRQFGFITGNYAASSFITPTICFALLSATLGFLELYIAKKKCFCFFLAKTRCNHLYSIKSIFWFVCRKIVFLPVLLHLEKVFFQFAVSHPDFHFILLKTTFLPV